MRNTSVVATIVVLLFIAVADAAAQGQIRGSAYDSLIGAPLAGADVLVRGTTRRAVVDSSGHFRFDSVPAGRQVLMLSHPGLDSAGIYTLATVVVVEAERVATAQLATPSLRTIWRRLCRTDFVAGADSGVLVGAVSDATTGNRLAGAAVVASWLDLRQVSPTDASAELRTVATLTDSIGNYAACGVGTDATVHVRAYGAGDSTGSIQTRPGGRPVARRDFTVGPTVRGAAIAGVVRGGEGQPLAGARLSVDSTSTTSRETGAYRLAGLPSGTQWLTVRTVGRAPVEQVVDLKDGETLRLDVDLGLVSLTLDTVRVRAQRLTATLQEIEDRRRGAGGYYRGAEDLRGRPDVVTALQGFPSVRAERNRNGFAVILPPRNARERGCVATVYLDGMRSSYDELLIYKTEEIRAIEIYPRASTVPLKYPGRNGCGVLLVWTKYLQ